VVTNRNNHDTEKSMYKSTEKNYSASFGHLNNGYL